MTSRHALAAALCLSGIGLSLSGTVQADARAEVTAAFQSAMQAQSYRLNIETANRRGPIRSQLDVQLPDRFHMRADETEFVVVPEGTWINAAGTWMKVPVDMSAQLRGYRLQDIGDASAKLDTVERVGTDTVNGCESTLYRYATTSSFAGRRSDDDVELAVCDSTGKPIRLRSTPRRKGEETVITYDFDTAIDIKAPR